MTDASLAFLPFLRRGAATLIHSVPANAARANVDVTLGFASGNVQRDFELYGPGEITGFDARAVTRTWPGKNVMDADTNAFAHIEFDQADLPWRYSPFPTRSDIFKPAEHILTFEGLQGQEVAQQQFSMNGAWWLWRVIPTFTIGDSARLKHLTQAGLLGTIDFDEAVTSFTVQCNGTVNMKSSFSDPDWIPEIVLEGFRMGVLVQQLNIPVDGLHIGAFTLTVPEANALTSLAMRLTVPPQFSPPIKLPTVEFEFNRLTYISLHKSTTTTDLLRPWCVLIVLRPEEILEYTPPEPKPLPSIKVPLSALPDLAQSWSWAHTQVSGRTSISVSEALAMFETAPQMMLSRIICPRVLDRRVPYRAFLVPAFERGRLAGLGEALTFHGSIEVPAAIDAWTSPSTATDVTLPVYYEWQFQTAEGVDFESLARALKPKPLPPEVGARPVDASEPGASLPPASAEPLWIEGALKAASPEHEWNANQRLGFVQAFANLLNVPKQLLAGTGMADVVPPLYGRWLAARDDVDSAQSGWFDAINTDPRLRVAAGAASQIVEQHEEKILNGAWRQIEGLPEINETLRFAQFARAIARRMRERRLQNLSDESFFFLHAPLFRRVKLGNQTVAALIARSRLRRGVFEPAFRRLLRRMRRHQQITTTKLFDRMNSGEIAAAREPATPSVITIDENISASTFANAQPQSSFAIVEVGPGHPIPSLPPPVIGTPDATTAFRTILTAMANQMNAPRVVRPLPITLSFPAIRSRIESTSNPATTIEESIQARLHFAPGFMRATSDPLEPVLASPEFDQPMYEPLRELSEEWILPGLSAFETNTISLAVVNQPFLEAYMLGLSHELTRSLLFRGYPTDQRGTYFRQFWDNRGYFGPRTREQLRDIRAIDSWPLANAAGKNSSSPPLVLLLRGDLLRQYPTAIVYATRATTINNRREPLAPADERHPVFRGRIGGDIAFFGFDLTAAEARGGSGDDGWFFALQEQPNEPRFGVDAPQTWDTTNTTSAQLARDTLRRTKRILLHASDMLPPE